MLMREIYRKADITIVWLGEAAHGSGLAYGLIRAWAGALGTALLGEDSFESFLEQCPFALKPAMCDGVRKLFERSWWDRM